LNPNTPTNPIASFISGNDFVDVRLENLCSNPLQIQPLGFRIRWNTAVAPPGTRLTSIIYPGATQTLTPPGDATGTVNSTPPAGAQQIGPGTNTYTVRITFDRPQNQAANPVTNICVFYQRPTVDVSNQSCQVFPTGGSVCP
jgi:hypothetical protein